MGTDIHFYVERREGSRWVSCDTWEPYEYLDEGEVPYNSVPYGKHLYSVRNYDLFAILADVRNGRGFAGVKTGEGFVPISPPRGLPDDLSPELAAEAARRMEHTPSWLLVSEIMAFDWTQTTTKTGLVSVDEFCRWRAWGRSKGEGPQSYSGGIFGASVTIIDADEMELKVSELHKSLRESGKSNADIWKSISARLPHHYCQVSWGTPYYRAASHFLAECLPRLWRFGKPEDVRCVFWFDS